MLAAPEDSSGVTGTRYFMNHCAHCDAKLGDFETIEELDAPLRLTGTASASRLLRYPVNERLEADIILDVADRRGP